MIAIPSTNIIITNGEYGTAKKRKAGRSVIFELTGTFDSASIVPGFLAVDGTTFVADGTAKTAAGRFEVRVPKSGYPMLKVTSAGASAAVVVTTTDRR